MNFTSTGDSIRYLKLKLKPDSHICIHPVDLIVMAVYSIQKIPVLKGGMGYLTTQEFLFFLWSAQKQLSSIAFSSYFCFFFSNQYAYIYYQEVKSSNNSFQLKP